MDSTLFSPDGIEIPVSSPTEVVRLKARGYTEDPPVTVEADQFDPAEHTVPEVLTYIEAHPEQGDAVVAAERAGQNRKGITGE